MNRRSLSLIPLLAASLSVTFGSIAVTKAQAQTADSASTLAASAQSALTRGDAKAAIAAVEKLIKAAPDQSNTMSLAGDVYLRTGNSKEAVRWFDKYIQQRPAATPYLWQRGIALYFIGEHEAGAKQFEVHRRVNPNDVENAAWHFLCVSKAKSFEEAKKVILPAPGDPRIPMAEVLEMLRTGDTESVRKRMNAVPENTPERRRADFYGNFYLGLYADAQGDSESAVKYLQASADEAPHHYMGDVARVYRDYLKKAQQQESESTTP